MELRTFLSNATVQNAVQNLIRTTQPADQGYYGAELFPEQVLNVQSYSRNVTILSGAMIANDVAPLNRGVMKGGLKRVPIGGGLVDSATDMHFDGQDIESLREMVEAMPGETVSATAPELMNYLGLVDQHLVAPLVMNRERKRWNLLGRGQVYRDGARDDDFTKPVFASVFAPSQITNVTQASGESIYGGANADFFGDVRTEVEAARKDGAVIAEIVMNRNTLSAILNLPSTRQQLGLMTMNVATGGALSVNMSSGAATETMLQAKLRELGHPGIRVYDGYWQDQVRTEGDPEGPVGTVVTGYYVPDGRVIFIPRASTLDTNITNPTVPFRVAVFDPSRAIGIHVIGRMTGQDTPGQKVFGPKYTEGLNPKIDGESGVAHMPFLNVPYGVRVINYAKV